ncbi:MAG: hypothetical protein JSS62_06780, partial [Verrucomicrobia bacterium]|nr:hypothetical protein [Verrucomicrobiota bacterium]
RFQKNSNRYTSQPISPPASACEALIAKIPRGLSIRWNRTLDPIFKVLSRHPQQEEILTQIQTLATQTADPEDALLQISSLLYLLSPYTSITLAQITPWYAQIVQRLHCFLFRAKTLRHRNLLDKDVRNLLPQGTTHHLLHHFAKILYPNSGWNPGGPLLLRKLLTCCQITRFLKQEHIEHILALLNHPLETELESVNDVHPSMEIVIHTTLGLHLSMPIKPYHVRQALLMALLFCPRQDADPNCYIIACIPYLTSNTPHLFLRYLYNMLKTGNLFIEGKAFSLTNFFPYLKLPKTWLHTTMTATALFSLPAIQGSLRLCGVPPPFPCPASQASPYNLLREHLKTSVTLFSNVQMYVQATHHNPIIQLFIFSEELRQCNSTHSKALADLCTAIDQEVRVLLPSLPATVIDPVIKSFTHNLVVKNNPANFLSFYASCTTLSYPETILFHKLKDTSASLCLLRNGYIHHLFQFQDLARALIEHLHKQIPLLPPLRLSPEFFPKIAALAAHTFSEETNSLNQVTADLLLSLDVIAFCKQGGSHVSILQRVLPSVPLRETVLHGLTSVKALVLGIQQSIYDFCQDSANTCFIINVDRHDFFTQISPNHPLALTPKNFEDALKTMEQQGKEVLTRTRAEPELLELLSYCYENESTLADMKKKFRSLAAPTFEQALSVLIAHASKPYVAILKQKIQKFLSRERLSLQLLQDLISQLAPSADPVALGHAWLNKIPSYLHPHQLRYYLHRMLIKENYQPGPLALHPCYLVIADLNHTPLDKETSKHIHLLVEFDFVTQQLALFQASKYQIAPYKTVLKNCSILC